MQMKCIGIAPQPDGFAVHGAIKPYVQCAARDGGVAPAEERGLRDYLATHLRLAAHEMRRPIGVIHGWLSMLEDGTFGSPPDAESFRQALVAMAHAVSDMQAMTDRMAVAAMQGDRVEMLQRRPCRLAEVIADAATAVETDARTRRVRIALEGPDLEVNADAELLRVALLNLASNAVRHASSEVAIGVVPLVRHGVVVITVSDDGPGISSEAADHIFEPWYRGPGATDDGLGLGLSLVQRIALWHGGDVSLATKAEVGTTFRMVIPITAHTRQVSGLAPITTRNEA